ncbi:type VI secretion system-associated FHA domain protein [Agrobacterium larrymoorei]|uniref:FHA domain-containing protein n=1 Tax=Agrobacterium larrymoorei TaxID=160699 RepID=A0AAF0HFG4_9HYPH|nr:FHA domain-containing protein [Agrobacterium larrymoorei]WHA43710.1 FHA domain-containing protein [Agrobacterium larrymoorei]
MKLALKEKQQDGRFQPSRWSFEHGRRVLGRSNDCDWQIDDGERRVSKIHCTLSRDREGFSIVDQSANGTLVDGRVLLEGQSARLKDGSRIDIGGQTFEVAISGEPEMDFGDPDRALRVSDEQLTISAILSDIAPGGRSARGVLGNSSANDDWPDDAKRVQGKKAKSISKNVEIGWSAPPSSAGLGTVLPDDWNEEPVESSKHEHTDALNTPVKVARPAAPAEPREDFDAVFTGPDDAVDDEPLEPVSFRQDDRLAELVSHLERECAECLAVLDIEGEAGGHAEHANTAARLEALIRQQRLLFTSLENLMRVSTQKLEPRLLEAKADVGNDLRSKIERKDWRGVITRTDYWSFYKKQFDESGRQLSIRQFLQQAARGDAEEQEKPAADEANFNGVSTENEA